MRTGLDYRLRSIIVVFALLWVAPLGTAAVPVPMDPGESGIENLFRVTDTVLSGSEPRGRAGFMELARRGVKTIISVDGLRPDVEGAAELGIAYVHIPIGYEGIPAEASAALAKTLRTRPGPFYIHCHHGKHRGPALGAVALRLQTQCSDDSVLDWMKRAGVGEEYEGLWRDAVAFRAESIEGMDPVLVESAAPGGLAEAMASIGRIWDRLKACEAAGWNSPPGHSDVSPLHEAVMLQEEFTEMKRQSFAGYTDGAFSNVLIEAVNRTSQLSEALASENREGASKALLLVQKSCKNCHRDWRN